MNIELIEAKIREINESIDLLNKITEKNFDKLTIYERLSVRYLIIQAIEASASICMHILLKAFNERAEGYPQCFTRLGKKGVIPSELAEKLASVTRLRNLLVHRYWEIDDWRVYKSVKKGLSDFNDFINYIRKFLEVGRYHEA
ncbi:MAG: DUF86 domain-containing protein [archaeon GB-1867-035]|nr:DUF86 domain-containing protein [Candidatus Culexmicrobium profundum]